MKILYSPIRSDEKLLYKFDDNKITAYYGDATDEFDFTNFTDGELDSVETELPITPIVSAKCVEGELYVELLYFHSANAYYEEKFPQWKDHTELKVGVFNG